MRALAEEANRVQISVCVCVCVYMHVCNKNTRLKDVYLRHDAKKIPKMNVTHKRVHTRAFYIDFSTR